MANVSSPARLLELESIDAPTPTGETLGASADGAPVVAQPEDINAHGVDRWLAAAGREFQSGWVDRALWEHLLAQAGGDEAQTKVAYLRTRASVLQIAERDRRSGTSKRRVRSVPKSPSDDSPPETDDGSPAPETDGGSPTPQTPTPKSMPRLAIVFGLALIAVGIGFVATHRESPVVAQPSASPGATRSGPGSPAQPGNASPAAAGAGGVATSEATFESLEDKVAKLSEAGNWNVLVLYASEWTRKEPANVNAWIQLSIGFTALRQFGDALDAAAKAAQTAPGNPRVWRNLGQANMALDRPDEALKAFEQAAALDDHDVTSLVQLGLLNAQLGRLPQAKAALDKALEASPEDAAALCGQALVARQQGRPKDADAIAGKLQSHGLTCRNANESASVAVVATPPAAQKSVPPRTR